MLLSDTYDVHVLTRTYSRSHIEGHPDAAKLTFHYVDYFGSETQHHHWRFIKPYYVLWQFLVLFKVLQLQARYRFKVIHHVTYNNIDVPGFLWLVPNSRFIWGPVGGGQTAPKSLAIVYGDDWWKENMRRLLKASARYNPIIRAAIKRASMVLLANQETADRLSGLRFQSALMPETAISDKVQPPSVAAPRTDNKVRLLWLSHAFPRKALTLAIDGFRQALEMSNGEIGLELTVVGDGSDLPRAKAMVERYGLSQSASFVGAVPYAEVDRRLSEADIFLFTSVQDTSGNVLFEAMRNAKPIVALNHQGAKALIKGGGAFLVDIGTYAATETALGAAIVKLARDPVLRREMGLRNLREVFERHTWAAKREQVLPIYNEVISRQ